jgi:hypothetical protein
LLLITIDNLDKALVIPVGPSEKIKLVPLPMTVAYCEVDNPAIRLLLKRDFKRISSENLRQSGFNSRKGLFLQDSVGYGVACLESEG